MSVEKIINENAINDASRLAPSGIAIRFTPVNGSAYSNYDGCFYYKIGTRVTLHVGLKGLTPNSNNTVFTMPQGYKPAGMICVAGTGGASYTAHAHCTVDAYTGSVIVSSSDQYANITLEYDAFS